MKSWEEITDCSEFWSVKGTLQTLYGTETRRTVVRGPKGHWYISFHTQRTTTVWTQSSTLQCSFSIYHALTIARETKFSLISQNFSKTTPTLLTGAAFVESLLKCTKSIYIQENRTVQVSQTIAWNISGISLDFS